MALLGSLLSHRHQSPLEIIGKHLHLLESFLLDHCSVHSLLLQLLLSLLHIFYIFLISILSISKPILQFLLLLILHRLVSQPKKIIHFLSPFLFLLIIMNLSLGTTMPLSLCQLKK